MTIREGKWDCPQCGHKGNRGSELKCRACGRPRGNEIKFYLEDDAPEVTDAAALAKANAGADWICQFCDGINPAAGKHCKNCGAERTEKKREVQEILDAPAAPPAPATPAKKKSSLGLVLGIVGAFAALCCGGGYFLLGTSERALTLDKVSWERTVEVEKYGTVVEEAWRDELPAGARVQSTSQKLHHTNHIQTGTRRESHQVDEKVQTGTRTVKVGKRDKGNGYFEDVERQEPVYEHRSRTVTEDVPVYRDDPVYKDWCRYEIEKWHKDRVERAGAEDLSPRWPEVASSDKEKPGKKTEKYLAVFKDDKGKTFDWDAPFDVWKDLSVGKGYKVNVTHLGTVEGLAKK